MKSEIFAGIAFSEREYFASDLEDYGVLVIITFRLEPKDFDLDKIMTVLEFTEGVVDLVQQHALICFNFHPVGHWAEIPCVVLSFAS